ncbi:MAG TPA: hypothetical protein DCQ58_06970 [Saprospirales bacterium]|nr:hypothetical protein [Saprospirales bacterium]
MEKNTLTNKSAWILMIIYSMVLMLLINISGCGLIDTSSGKCVEEVFDKTTYKYEVTVNELLNGTGPFFKVEYDVVSDKDGQTASFEFIKSFEGCRCYEDDFGRDLWTEASAYIYTPIESKGGCTVTGYSDLNQYIWAYTFVRTGSGPNMTHYYGTQEWIDLEEDERCAIVNSKLKVRFPTKGGKSLDASFVVDSLKLGLFFQSRYDKP